MSLFRVSMVLLIALVVSAGSSVQAADNGCLDATDKPVTDLPLVFCDDFESGADNWEPAVCGAFGPSREGAR